MMNRLDEKDWELLINFYKYKSFVTPSISL